MTEPWQCPSCGAEHRCGGDAAAPANITVNMQGSVLDEKTLIEAVQRASRWRRP